MRNIVLLITTEVARVAESGPSINGTVMSLIVVACSVLIAAGITAFMRYKSKR